LKRHGRPPTAFGSWVTVVGFAALQAITFVVTVPGSKELLRLMKEYPWRTAILLIAAAGLHSSTVMILGGMERRLRAKVESFPEVVKATRVITWVRLVIVVVVAILPMIFLT
jgi:hypothetical protein